MKRKRKIFCEDRKAKTHSQIQNKKENKENEKFNGHANNLVGIIKTLTYNFLITTTKKSVLSRIYKTFKMH